MGVINLPINLVELLTEVTLLTGKDLMNADHRRARQRAFRKEQRPVREERL